MKRIVFLYAFCVFVLAGCDQKPPSGENQVLIHLTAHPLTNTDTKSSATDNEKTISKVLLYGVDDQGMVVKTFPGIANPSLTGIELTVPMDVKTIYAIANPTSGIESVTPSTLSDLLNLTNDFSVAPQSPFLMSGKGDIVNSTANIELIRAVAKIEIISQNEFQIESVTVKNSPHQGYVFKQETPTPPSSANKVAYPTVYSTNPVVYVPENSKNNPTEFVVTGTYFDLQASYTIVITTGGAPADIVRNTHYRVGVSAITETDCSIDLTIPPWNDYPTSFQQAINVPNPNLYKNGIKILTIGNSYTQNTLLYLPRMLRELGVTGDIKIVNAYIPGAYLKQHAENMKNGTHASEFEKQEYYQHPQIQWFDPSFTIYSTITEANWDVIVLQQADDDWNPWPPATDSYIQDVIEYLDLHSPKKDYKLGWLMTWSYSGLPVTGGDNQIGYNNLILNNLTTWIAPKLKSNGGALFDFIIPIGTAIQNGRLPTRFGDHLNRDSPMYGVIPHPPSGPDPLHLNNIGCYIAAAMWIKTITGYDVADLMPYQAPSTQSTQYNGVLVNIDQTMLDKIVPAVNAAHNDPYTFQY